MLRPVRVGPLQYTVRTERRVSAAKSGFVVGLHPSYSGRSFALVVAAFPPEACMALQPVLIDGAWRESAHAGTFVAENPATGAPLPEAYPISAWQDCDAMLSAATQAASVLRTAPGDQLAVFLENYAGRIEANAAALVARANLETALPVKPRLADVELPRTVGQLRQAAAAAREATWQLPTIDTKLGIRSALAPLGPVWVFGPNNFPFAFNSVSGGDFAAAIAAGNPVIAKANSTHPGTTKLLAELALQALLASGLPPGTVQMIYRTGHADGERAVADARTGAIGYTGARGAGLALKRAADGAGKPIYLELSSINPVAILPGALAERGDAIVQEFVTSALMGCGQFCTNPGLVLLVEGAASENFVRAVGERFQAAPVGTLLSRGVARLLANSVQKLTAAGAKIVAGGTDGDGALGPGYSYPNTLLRLSGEQFLADPHACQTEAFGNVSLIVVVSDTRQLITALDQLEGNLTGTIYSDTQGKDDAQYEAVVAHLRARVGRLLNDRMPTGVAVSPAMNHGGPYPATGHPGFTAVGIPAALRRFGVLECFDQVREQRLPPLLQNANPLRAWRLVDGTWTWEPIGG
jgi:alpha-ketoglutaric semialdehyde dehydrogenase